jgi:outer membrane receptor protein involved in Fe transport
MNKQNISPLLLSVFVTLLISFAVNAQTSGSIKGVITDEQKGKISGANVVLQSDSGLQLSTVSDAAGAFEFKTLNAGSYLLDVRAPGFALSVHPQIRLARGESKDVDIELEIAAVNASVVVTASGTPERLEESAKVVSVVDAQNIEARHELGLAEALRGTPGVRIQQQGSPGALTTLRIRGQRNFDTAFLLDGLRVRDAGDINGSALSLISDFSPVSMEQVEILRGSGSSIYGTHAVGGVVNMIPDGGSGDLHFTGGFEGGTLATYRERLSATAGGDRYGFNVGVDRLDVRNGIDGDDAYGNTSFAGRAQFHPTQSITIAGTFYGNVANARVNDSPFALAGAFTGGQYPSAVVGSTFQPDFNNPDQGRRNQLLVGSGRFSQVVNDLFSYTVAYQRVSSKRKNYNGPLVDPRFVAFVPFGDFEFYNVNRGTIDTVDARVNLRFSASNLATVGFEFERESFFQSSNPSFATFNNTTDRQQTFALFGQDQLSFLDDRLRISIGARWQGYRLDSADRPGALAGREEESSVTGDGSIAYFFRSSGTKLRGHIGNGFRAPSLFERFGEGTFGAAGTVRFGDPTLRAEQSISVDGGIDQRLASDRVSFGVTYFYTRLQRVVAFTGFAVDPLGLGRFSGYVNRPGGIARGVEASLDTVPAKGMQLRASYTFTNSDRFVPGLGLQPEYVIPKHLVGLSWSQRYRAFLFSLEVNRTGAYLAPVFESNFPFRMAELTFAGYTKADAFASYERRLSERVTMTLFGGVENLFNEKYYENGFLAPRGLGRGG